MSARLNVTNWATVPERFAAICQDRPSEPTAPSRSIAELFERSSHLIHLVPRRQRDAHSRTAGGSVFEIDAAAVGIDDRLLMGKPIPSPSAQENCMTLDLLLKLLRCHLAALQSTAWPHRPTDLRSIWMRQTPARLSRSWRASSAISRRLGWAVMPSAAQSLGPRGALKTSPRISSRGRRLKRAGAVRDAHRRTHTEIRHGRDRPRLHSLAIIASTAETSGPRDVVASGLAAHEAVTTTALHRRPPLRRYACGMVASK